MPVPHTHTHHAGMGTRAYAARRPHLLSVRVLQAAACLSRMARLNSSCSSAAQRRPSRARFSLSTRCSTLAACSPPMTLMLHGGTAGREAGWVATVCACVSVSVCGAGVVSTAPGRPGRRRQPEGGTAAARRAAQQSGSASATSAPPCQHPTLAVLWAACKESREKRRFPPSGFLAHHRHHHHHHHHHTPTPPRPLPAPTTH